MLGDLTQWQAFGIYVAIIAGVLYIIDRLRRRLPPRDPPPDGPTDNNLLG
jgi:hypothetical protein